eukprot:5478515-Alexandrium_andersonii.AAC.1
MPDAEGLRAARVFGHPPRGAHLSGGAPPRPPRPRPRPRPLLLSPSVPPPPPSSVLPSSPEPARKDHFCRRSA